MSYGYLGTMLEYLTGAYTRTDIRNARHSLPPDTNIGRLFGTFAWGLELVHESADRMKLWDDIDNAQGKVLDRFGTNFGVERGGSSDMLYRLLIKVKMIALLSGGDIDTIIGAAASLFNLEPEQIELQEIFPSKIWLYVDESTLDAERLEAAPLIAQLMKRIAASGVGTRVFLRTYRSQRAKAYAGIACLDEVEITARPRSNVTISRRATRYIAMAVWEETTITAASRAR